MNFGYIQHINAVHLWLNLSIHVFVAPGTRLDHDVLEEIYPRPNRSKSFPVDPGNTHVPVSPQSSLDSDEENALRKMNSMSNENAHPGMKGKLLLLPS